MTAPLALLPRVDDFPVQALGPLPGVLEAWTQDIDGGGDGALPVVFVRFDGAAFTPNLFERLGIACPPAVRRAVATRRAEFLFGRVAARIALERIGCRVASVGIGESREPLWPAGVVGSISHAGDLAIAAACPRLARAAVGIDVECIASSPAGDALEQVALRRDELGLLEGAAGALTRDERLTLAFSAKESLFKAVFPSVGRHLGFDAARLTRLELAAGRLELTIAEPLGDGYPAGRVCRLGFASPRPGMVLTAFAPTVAPHTGGAGRSRR